MLRKMIAASCLALLLGWLSPAMAQSNNILIVASCGTQGFQASLTNLGILTEDTTGKLCVNATVSTSNAIGITPTDHTIASTSGSSQQIMAANATRHSITIENTGNANCGINPTGGTAVIGGAGTITLAALGSYTPRVPTLSAVNVICTAGQPIYADDN